MSHSTVRSAISTETAHLLVSAAVRAAEQSQIAISVAVVDDAGELMAFLRMDSAYFATCQLAADKAYSAAAFKMATHAWPSIFDADAAVARIATSARRLVPIGGGLPIVVDGAHLGAIGVSGGHFSQDIAVAKAALAEVLGERPRA